MNDTTGAVAQHYTSERLAERILEAAQAADSGPLAPAAIAAADEFHTGGLLTTRELAAFAGVQHGWKVLDIGSGIGGPARILASEFGCVVTGIDLTAEFVRTARVLTDRCGLTAQVTFVEGNALALPFDDGEFDAVWTQHVVMNIEDRETLYGQAWRVLRPGGVLTFFDILRGSGKEIDFPVPWADGPAISFLYTPSETREFLKRAGFEEVRWEDTTEANLNMLAAQVAAQTASPLSLRIVMGEDMPQKMRRAVDAVRDGRLAYARALYRKP